MFDFDAGKIIIVGVVALIFIPPKDLPRVLRQVGQFVGKMRWMASEFQGQFMDAMREADMADLKREAQKLSDAARISTGLDAVHDLNSEMTGALERSGRGPEPLPATEPHADVALAEAAREAIAHEAPPHEGATHDNPIVTGDHSVSESSATAAPPPTSPDAAPHYDEAKTAVGHSA